MTNNKDQTNRSNTCKKSTTNTTSTSTSKVIKMYSHDNLYKKILSRK